MASHLLVQLLRIIPVPQRVQDQRLLKRDIAAHLRLCTSAYTHNTSEHSNNTVLGNSECVHCIRAALNWLIENNPFYANVQIDESAMDMHAELETDVEMQDQADDPFRDVEVCELQHTTMMDVDPYMPVDVVQAVDEFFLEPPPRAPF